MRNRLIEFALALMFATTLPVTGCSDASNNGDGGAGGGGGGAGGGDPVTSISGSKPLNTLTSAEATQLCDDAKAYFARSITKANSCKFAALSAAASTSSPTDAALQNNCSAMEAACNQSASMGPGAATQCFPPSATCTATVAQYSACISGGVTQFNQSASALPGCTVVTLADLTPIFMAVEGLYQAPGCPALTAACPDLVFPIAN